MIEPIKKKLVFLGNRNQRGSILIISLVVITVLVILVAAFTSMIISEYRMASRSNSLIAALNLAEAGVEEAVWELSYGGADFLDSEGWSGTDSKTKSGTLYTSAGEKIGEYIIKVTDYTSRGPKIEATGYAPTQSQPQGQRTVKVILAPDYLFPFAAFGDESFRLTGGSSTDSYDSRLGTYGSQTPGQEGDVASNGSIILSGGSFVNGDATPGPGHNVSDPSAVSGSTSPAPSEVQLDPIPEQDIANAAANNNNSVIDSTYFHPGAYDLKLSGGANITLTAGTYYFTSVNISGGSVINTNGAVIIYCTGDFDTSGGSLVNQNQLPADLLIYSSSTPNDSVKISGGAGFFAGVYAPNVSIDISGGGDYYGSLVGGEVVDITGGSRIHYDLALRGEDSPFSGYSIASWQEM